MSEGTRLVLLTDEEQKLLQQHREEASQLIDGGGIAKAVGHEEHIDGCACDITLAADETMRDDELPEAIGGIAEA